MSEKTRLVAQCKAIDPKLRVVEALHPKGSVFEVVFSDGTTMRMQFERGEWSLNQQREVKLRMLREALIALRFAKPAGPPGVEMDMDPKRVEFGGDGVAREATIAVARAEDVTRFETAYERPYEGEPRGTLTVTHVDRVAGTLKSTEPKCSA